MTLILGIETSCDETAAAVVEDGVTIHSNVVASQHDLHAEFGGVVPEIASRAHVEKILPVLRTALDEAGVGVADIEAVAVGHRPGLIGSLLVGTSAAKAIAWGRDVPLLGVDHVEAHLWAPMMTESLTPEACGPSESRASSFKPQASVFPALGLVVSGGHTSLYHMTNPTQMRRIGSTIDDAVGEAYDKAAVILDVGYPGGPKLDALAQRGDATRAPGGPLPQSMLGSDNLDFSYSGLKTALLYRVRGKPVGRGADATFTRNAGDLTDADRADLAAAFQQAAIDVLFAKLHRALETVSGTVFSSLLIGGGVSANSRLRAQAEGFAAETTLRVLVPEMSLCMDNAAMIAGLAHAYLRAGQVDDLSLPTEATTRLEA